MEYVQENKVKTNIKMRVTPKQSRRVQEICFKNNIAWHGVKSFDHLRHPYIYVYENTLGYDCKESSEYFDDHENIEIDSDLFIRTNGTCEENEVKNFIQLQNEIKDGINEWAKQFNDIEEKLKKKNEILKKARIKRKNQREELHKLNIKLQKCIDLEAHKELTNDAYLRNRQIEDDFRESRKLVEEQQKEIQKLKAVIEYLESKVK